MNSLRPDWETTWIDVADLIAKRSRCDLRKIGAVIVSHDNSYLVVGYNGPPASFAVSTGSTCRSWCPRAQGGLQTIDYTNCISAHAETNAIAKADRTRINGGTLYVTSSICWDCGKIVANSGIVRMVCRIHPEKDAHRHPERTIKFLRDCGIEVHILGYEQV